MDSGPPIYTGFWIDYTQNWSNQYQITVTTTSSSLVQVLIGVLFGVAAPFLGNILVRCKEWTVVGWRRLSDDNHGGARSSLRSSDHDRQPLLAHGTSVTSYGIDTISEGMTHSVAPNVRSSNAANERMHVYLPSSPLLSTQCRSNVGASTSSPLPSIRNTIARHSQSKAPNTGKTSVNWKTTAFAIVLYIILSILWAIAGGYASNLKSTTSVLSKSTKCGSWSLRADASRQEMDDDDLVQAQNEHRAGQYGRDCYGDHSVVSPDRCGFFDNATVRFDILRDQPCPFVDASFCAGGVATAVRFTTGWTDASAIGLMAKEMPQFNRTTICVPLNLDRGFVRQIPPQEDFRFVYDLGSTNDSGLITNYTFRQFGDPFKWDIPAYSVSAYESTPYQELDYWLPRRELYRKDADNNHTYLTVFFITSCRIVYAGPSRDYIFHADAPFLNTGKYWNSDPRARPLACIDWTHLRSSKGSVFHMDEEFPERIPEYEFVRSALRKSTMFQSLRFRLGSGLIAQEGIGDFESPKLPDDQWIEESRAMFETSLARIQHDALDIAIGRGHEKDPGQYEEDTLPWARGRLCNMYKFQIPASYTNINTLAMAGLIALVIMLIVAGIETSQSYDGRKDDCFSGGLMIFEIIMRSFVLAVRRICTRTSKIWSAS